MRLLAFEDTVFFITSTSPRYPNGQSVTIQASVHLRHPLHLILLITIPPVNVSKQKNPIQCFIESPPTVTKSISQQQHMVTPQALSNHPPLHCSVTVLTQATPLTTGSLTVSSPHVRKVNNTHKSGSFRGLTANIWSARTIQRLLRRGLTLSKLHPQGLCYCSSTTVTVLGQVHKQMLQEAELFRDLTIQTFSDQSRSEEARKKNIMLHRKILCFSFISQSLYNQHDCGMLQILFDCQVWFSSLNSICLGNV